MEARHLMILRELGDRGSVSAVATALHLTPSAVSQQLAGLQRGVPVPLTRLDGRVLVLTDAGRSLAAAAVGVAAALARAGAAVDAHLTDPTATVRVVAFHSAASAFFPPLLRAGVASIECADEDVAQEAFPLLSASYDVVVAHRPAGSGAWPPTVSTTRLLSEPLDVAVPATHPLATKPSLHAADVAGEQWIAVHEGFPLTGAIHAIGVAAGHQLDVRHHINDFTVAADLVAAGAGLALLPRYTGPRRSDVVLRPVAGLPIAREIDVLTRPEQRFRAAVTTVIDQLVSIATSVAADTDPGEQLRA
jgi:DNA-binding transcriptional LysR family regulator